MTPTELATTLLSGLKLRAVAAGLPRAHVDKFEDAQRAIIMLVAQEAKHAKRNPS